MTAVSPLVLVADDDPSVRTSLTRLLASSGYVVEAFASARGFLAREPHPVRVELERAWRDGMTGLLFEPVEFLEKLAALDGARAASRLRCDVSRAP